MSELALRRSLDGRARRELERYLAALLRWSGSLSRWPKAPRAPNAIPFVSLYAGGRLVGCYGSDEGDGGQRVARAFLRAMNDGRFGGVALGEHSAQLSYVHSLAICTAAEAVQELVPGIHGLGLPANGGRPPVFLLPHVAPDGSLDGEGVVATLFAKAGRPRDDRERVILFETDDVVSHPGPVSPRSRWSPVREASEWLSRRVDERGRVTFAVDPKQRAVEVTGRFHHGRAAIVARALALVPRTRPVARRALERLAREARRALRGAEVDAWPTDPAEIAATLALAVLAGAGLERDLAAFVDAHVTDIARTPWYAAEVICAMGRRAPAPLVAVTRASLDVERAAFAAWALIAARAIDDRAAIARATRVICMNVRRGHPARGAFGSAPHEVAMAALALEALRSDTSRGVRRAKQDLHGFLVDRQLRPERTRAALDPTLSRGAFPLTTIHDVLRSDVTAHALLALA